MAPLRPRIATSLSWISAFAAIASCTTVTDPSLCGDDAYYYSGLDVHLAGASDEETYEIDVVADGTTFSLTQSPGDGYDYLEIPLGDETILQAAVGWSEDYPLEKRGSLLEITYKALPDDGAWGPSTAAITVTMQGETVQETFTPHYFQTEPSSAQCRGTQHAFEVIGVPTP